jgi:hypothetical protein
MPALDHPWAPTPARSPASGPGLGPPVRQRLLGVLWAAIGFVTGGAVPGLAQAGVAPAETWQVTASHPLPGLAAGAPVSAATAMGALWRLTAGALLVDGLPGCHHPRHQYLRVPVEGLFQGLLQDLPSGAASGYTSAAAHNGTGTGTNASTTASTTAAALASVGIADLPPSMAAPAPLPTQRIDCDNASFDLHRVAPDVTLTALDGRVLSLRRLRSDDTLLSTVADLMLTHLLGDPAFTPAHVTTLSPWLSPGLAGRMTRWLARPASPDEVPAINGDPLTDAQEYPEAFELQPPRVQGDRAELEVRFSLGQRHWPVSLLLRHRGSRWQLDDVRYADGSRLRQLLR